MVPHKSLEYVFKKFLIVKILVLAPISVYANEYVELEGVGKQIEYGRFVGIKHEKRLCKYCKLYMRSDHLNSSFVFICT